MAKGLVRLIAAFFLSLVAGSGVDAQTMGANTSVPFDAFQTMFPEEEKPVRRYKEGFFQRLEFSGGVLVPSADDIENSFLESTLSVAVPLGSLENILVVSPSFRVDRLDSSLAIDVPDHVYVTGVSFLWRKEWNERWGSLAIVTPSLRTDFKSDDSGLRVFGLALAQWNWVPDVLQISFGAAYLDRKDLPPVLPAAGLVWTPTPRWQFDLIFPRPKISYQIWKEGCRAETWAYLSTALGGNTWSVERASGLDDELSLKDYRLLLGVERVIEGGGGFFLETGYAFSRELEYEFTGERIDLSDGWVFQGGFRF